MTAPLADSLASLAAACAGYLPTLALAWLAYFFGRTLGTGRVPLIETVARVGKPVLSSELVRYTRSLTVAWVAYFVSAAVLVAASKLGFARASTGIALVSALLFVGEYWLRRNWWFRDEAFPGLAQQIRDTVSVWRRRREA